MGRSTVKQCAQHILRRPRAYCNLLHRRNVDAWQQDPGSQCDSGQACIPVHCCQHALVVDSALGFRSVRSFRSFRCISPMWNDSQTSWAKDARGNVIRECASWGAYVKRSGVSLPRELAQIKFNSTLNGVGTESPLTNNPNVPLSHFYRRLVKHNIRRKQSKSEKSTKGIRHKEGFPSSCQLPLQSQASNIQTFQNKHIYSFTYTNSYLHLGLLSSATLTHIGQFHSISALLPD